MPPKTSTTAQKGPEAFTQGIRILTFHGCDETLPGLVLEGVVAFPPFPSEHGDAELVLGVAKGEPVAHVGHR